MGKGEKGGKNEMGHLVGQLENELVEIPTVILPELLPGVPA